VQAQFFVNANQGADQLRQRVMFALGQIWVVSGVKLNDAQMQLSKISIVALTANAKVQTGGMTNMMKIASMVRSRKMMQMDFNDDDWARVKKTLEQEKRVTEQINALAGVAVPLDQPSPFRAAAVVI